MPAINVVVSGAAGQVGYSLLPQLCGGYVLGADKRINLRMLDIAPSLEVMEGVKMELLDCAYDLVDEITLTTDAEVAFKDADIAILLGGFPRKAGMERKDLIAKNTAIFKVQGEAIEKVASRDIKVLVVANPANTNCLVCMRHAPSIPTKNFSALMRLDHERMRSLLTQKINEACGANTVTSTEVRNCIIWGNHSATQVPDASHVTINKDGEAKPLSAYYNDKEWLEGALMKDVQQRGAAIIKARKLSSALSVASAIKGHMRAWLYGTDEVVSMGILSNGNKLGVPENIIFSFPMKCHGDYQVSIDESIKYAPSLEKLIENTTNELLSEKHDASSILGKEL
ncbi:malate dehydrogenase [Thraustotheca clavata]|uniref:malate dehydrogenase n=1 Tax=Thraustotheca clavata TaxID=74557 RepID=A0A1W0AA83_9STRA|nr:malate dehydrogenase [Thraustotheca clavata]